LCPSIRIPGYESDSFASRQVHAYYGFGPLTACLAVNYLDRFLSLYQLPVRIVKAYEVMVEWHCLLLGAWNKNGVQKSERMFQCS
jgi:hypothetical protein